MIKTATFVFPLFLVSIAGHPRGFAPAPDLLPPGTHGVHFVPTIDAGAFASGLFRSHVIAKGDTFDGIAKRECGDVRCSEEIRLLNPKVKPEELQPGSRIVIPPRLVSSDSRATSRTAGVATTGWLLFQRSWRFFGGEPRPVVADQPLEHYRGQAVIMAVPRERLRAFLSQDWRLLAPDKAIDGVVQSDAVFAIECVPEDDPAWKVEASIKLKEIEGGRLVIEVRERRFDEGGKLLSDKPGRSGAPEPRQGGMSLPLAAIGASALLGLIGLARRRRAISARGA